MSEEQKLVKDALERLNSYTGLPFEIERPSGKGYDFVIRIADIWFMAVVKSIVFRDNKNLIYAPLANKVKHPTMQLIIIAERIPSIIAKRSRIKEKHSFSALRIPLWKTGQNEAN